MSSNPSETPSASDDVKLGSYLATNNSPTPSPALQKDVFQNNDSAIPVHHQLPAQFAPLTQAVIDGVEKFVIFIGYPRSGHSIIGSYMDSHPNMIIAHEYPLFEKLFRNRLSKNMIFNALYKKSYDELISGWRGETNVQNKGYSLAVDGLWQAMFDELKVIGNKHGGTTVQQYRKHPEAFLSTIEYLKTTVNVSIHAMHVARNPFDMIATQTLYVDTGIEGVRTNASEENKFTNTKLLTDVAMDMVRRVNAATKLIQMLDLPTLEVHIEDLVHDPILIMKSICDFVGVDCPEYFLKACKEKTFSSFAKSRNKVVWPQSLIDLVQKRIENIALFQQYSFSN